MNLSSLKYCSHGKRLLNDPEDCIDCENLYAAVNALDYAKALVRALDKQVIGLSKKEQKTND